APPQAPADRPGRSARFPTSARCPPGTSRSRPVPSASAKKASQGRSRARPHEALPMSSARPSFLSAALFLQRHEPDIAEAGAVDAAEDTHHAGIVGRAVGTHENPLLVAGLRDCL